MMTLYLLFDALESGKTKLTSRVVISAHAAAQAPSKLGLKPGQSLSVRDAILALVTKSANDVAVAVGEHLAGSESAFATRMTQKAHQLGMSHTTFRNASGLPNSGQVTTARDLAVLGRALQEHHAEYFRYFSTRSFVWKGRRIGNHNHLLGRIDGVNGIKTGYTRASGFNLVTSVERGNRHIVAVVLGGDTSRSRDKRMTSLIASYLPKASTGRHTAAAIPGKSSAIARIDPGELPLPRIRPDDEVVETASVDTSADAKAQPTAKAQSISVASLIGANSVFALDAADPVDQGDTSADEDSSDAEAPGAVIAGWKIQIAATPTQASAEDILDQALSKASRVLGNASPYTEPVVSGGSTLYRARFAGFAGKAQARAACAYLAKRDFSCLALSD
jgi:D-alanyl-D-alanine carboxypeptidase